PAALQNNTTGNNNTGMGYAAGFNNTTTSFNTFLGAEAIGTATTTNATAIGARAQVTQSNSLVLGSISGVNGATADTNVGIGVTAPSAKLHIVANSAGELGHVLMGDVACVSGTGSIGFVLAGCADYALLGGVGN